MKPDFAQLPRISWDQLMNDYRQALTVAVLDERGKPTFDRYGDPIMCIVTDAAGKPVVEVPQTIRQQFARLREGAIGFVRYCNMQLDSSELGRRSVVPYGPGRQFKTLDDLPPWINDLPSRRQYPDAICVLQEKEETI